jgi:hypothetical protein
MMRHILMQVCHDQEQFQHSITLLRIGLGRTLFEVSHRRERVRKQPFQAARVDKVSFAAALHRVIGANKSFIQKMVEAQLLAGKTFRDRIRTPGPLAISTCDSGCHFPPRGLAGFPARDVRERLAHFYVEQADLRENGNSFLAWLEA